MAVEGRIFINKIACKEIIKEDNNSVFSRQWIKIPHIDMSMLTPAFLVESYMAFIRKCTLFIVQPVQSGERIAFTLFGSSLPLLIFSGPEYSGNDHTQTAVLRIEGGVLVQRHECAKGIFSLDIELVEEGVQVAVQVCDYCPLLLGGRKSSPLQKWLYRWTQALIHKIIASAFLHHLCRQLESGKSRRDGS